MAHIELPDLDKLTTEIVTIAREAGEIILEIFHSDFAVRAKADKSPVTEADEKAEAHILARLAKLTPDIPAIGEEMYAAGQRPDVSGGTFWLIDALDGTSEFTKRGEDFTVNIALILDGKPILGVVHAPALEQTFWGSPVGAFRSIGTGAPTPMRARTPGRDGLVSLTSKSHRTHEDEYLKDFTIKQDIPRGSSLKYCLIAAGEADISPRLGPTSEWDIAAAHAVLSAAGGSLTQLDGTPIGYGKANILNPHFVARGLT